MKIHCRRLDVRNLALAGWELVTATTGETLEVVQSFDGSCVLSAICDDMGSACL